MKAHGLSGVLGWRPFKGSPMAGRSMHLPEKLEARCPDGNEPPRLLVVIHTEEQFDWSAPFDREATAVSHIHALLPLHERLLSKGVKPTYVVDFPIASKLESVEVIRQLLVDQGTTIGTHLHPWVSPPYQEEVIAHNSYPGNLPEPLERAKLHLLSEQIEHSFGKRPTAYLAGRYGYGPNTGRILSDLGYEIDLSAAPLFSFSSDGGPDYSSYDCYPFWTRNGKLLRIPHTSGHVGLLCRGGKSRFTVPKNSIVRTLLARTRCVERLQLSPEGYSAWDMQRLTKALLRGGARMFLFSFHSPSLEPGHTPYVRSQSDVDRFNWTIHEYLTFFRDAIGGVFCTPHEARAAICDARELSHC